MDITTIPCGTSTRDKVAEYRDENGFKNYDEALKSLMENTEYADA